VPIEDEEEEEDGHRRCPKHVDFRDKIKILDT
jgi:hypothetical protein